MSEKIKCILREPQIEGRMGVQGKSGLFHLKNIERGLYCIDSAAAAKVPCSHKKRAFESLEGVT
jgi:hypothetical protein